MSFDPRTPSTPALLRYFADILDELKARGVIRTRNNPVADYAEWLVSQRLSVTLMGNSASGYGAKSADGIRFQIKSRRLDPTNGSRQLSVIRNLPAREFDYLIGVLFDREFAVTEAYKIPHSVVAAFAKFSKHQNGHILMLQGGVLNAPGVENVTLVMSPVES